MLKKDDPKQQLVYYQVCFPALNIGFDQLTVVGWHRDVHDPPNREADDGKGSQSSGCYDWRAP
jgi:hypothetical protein